MYQQERLRTQEITPSLLHESQSTRSVITKEEVQQLYQGRKQRLEEVRSSVCLKFYETICEKIDQEKRLFERLLHWEDAKQDALSQYSFILNPFYFEQRFLGEE